MDSAPEIPLAVATVVAKISTISPKMIGRHFVMRPKLGDVNAEKIVPIWRAWASYVSLRIGYSGTMIRLKLPWFFRP